MTQPTQMNVFYHGGSLPVQIGDHIRTRIWLFFKKEGRVVYVPGISPKHPRLEHSGLRWVGVRCGDGLTFGNIIDPKTSCLAKKIILIKRDNTPIDTIRPEQEFIDS